MNQKKYIDLHTHTTASDGSLTPTELVGMAKANKLSAIAITDHDNTDGLGEGMQAGRQHQVEVIPGLELSVWREGLGSLHVLAYWIDVNNQQLQDTLEPLRDARASRNKKIHQRLVELGMPFAYQRLHELAKGPVIGRPHFAQALLEAGYVTSTQEAFDRFLARGQPAYVERDRLTPDQVVDLIHQARGVSVLAHPGDYKMPAQQIEEEIALLHQRGLDGIECYYPTHTPEQTQRFVQIASELGLAPTGGSDFHGRSKPNNHLGQPTVDYSLLTALKAKLPNT